jgi:hypothetical protein
MTIPKRILNPDRLRQVPEHFSWLDHRLVREHYIEKADVCAWALYLFLLSVADVHGLSYYSDATAGPAPALASRAAGAGAAGSDRTGLDRL